MILIKKQLKILIIIIMISSCTNNNITVYETSESGNNLTELSEFNHNESVFSKITINKDVKFQKITGFGGAFTESSAYNLNKLSKEKRDEVLKAYFSKEGANYSLTRTHMNSCDFSLNNYSYSPVEDDINLDYFSVEEDINDLIPMIKDATNIFEDGFKIFASPWTASPWMKDNNDYVQQTSKKYYQHGHYFFQNILMLTKNLELIYGGLLLKMNPMEIMVHGKVCILHLRR